MPQVRITPVEKWLNGGKRIPWRDLLLFLAVFGSILALILLSATIWMPSKGSYYTGTVMSVDSYDRGSGTLRDIRWRIEVDTDSSGPQIFHFDRAADRVASELRPKDQVTFYASGEGPYVTEISAGSRLLMDYEGFRAKQLRFYGIMAIFALPIIYVFITGCAVVLLRALGVTQLVEKRKSATN
ncbi:MAG: hypothetical protein AAGB29_10915 [Planctomycetota bacterium]